MSDLYWFVNDGGPLLILPREALPSWEGTVSPSGGRVVEAAFRWETPDAPATDYDRACDVEELAQVVEVGTSWGVVLGGEEMNEAWLGYVGPDTFALIRGWFDEEYTTEDVRALCAGLPDAHWKVLHPDLPLEHGDLLLMHAGSNGPWMLEKDNIVELPVSIVDAIPFHAQPGRYEAALSERVETDAVECIFVRFRRK